MSSETSIERRVLTLIECTAEPRHLETYYYEDQPDWYPAGCALCWLDAANEAHHGCAHSHHKAWRRWKITSWLASNLYASGLTSNGGSWQMGGGCMGCVTMPRWNRNKRVYVLWVRIETWRCLLKMRHFPGDPIGFGMCSKCLPCPTCGSKTVGHEASCEWSNG